MAERKLLQYGWLSGPVECCCSECDWTASFEAVDSSVPAELLAKFEKHDCRHHGGSVGPVQGGRKGAGPREVNSVARAN